MKKFSQAYVNRLSNKFNKDDYPFKITICKMSGPAAKFSHPNCPSRNVEVRTRRCDTDMFDDQVREIKEGITFIQKHCPETKEYVYALYEHGDGMIRYATCLLGTEYGY